MGEDRRVRYGLLRQLSSLDPHPESVPVNLLVRVDGTPLGDLPAEDPFELVRTIATARILMPASTVRLSAGRLVVDKTGLTGSYSVRMNYDQMSARRGPEVPPAENAGPSVFVALPEQLGLKLDASRTMVDSLIIDHLEKPTEN